MIALAEPFAPEISCRASINFCLYFERTYGRERLELAYAPLAVERPLAEVLDPKNWMSFDFAMRLLDVLAEQSGDPDFARKTGRTIVSPEALGFAYYMFRALGTPRLLFEKLVSIGPTFNKVGHLEIEKITDRSLLLHYRSDRAEPNRRSCETRIAQWAAFPLIWDLPEAIVHEQHCQVNGAPDCLYDVRWQPTAKPWLFALGGATLGAIGGALAFGTSLGYAGGAALGVSLGGSASLALGYHRSLRLKSRLLAEQDVGLTGSARDLSAQVEEIRTLNQTLERKVEDRTRELSIATAQLKSALDKQVELDRLKTQFFQNISHELRTPLTLILAPLDTITAENELDPETRLQLDIMRRSALRLLALINSLLDLSRLDAGKLRLSLDDLDPALAVRHLVESAQGLARQRGIVLSYRGPEQLALVPLDADKFEKSVLNLVSNALKFTGGDPSRAAEVVVSCAVEGDRLVVGVRDTGLGIQADELENIFARFHQVDGSDERRFGGTGIGLALVKELVEFHCGTVSVASTYGEGSTFTLNLPTSREAYPDDRLDRRRAREEVAVDRRSELERQKLARLIVNPSDLSLADITTAAASEPPPARRPIPSPATSPDRPRILVADDNRDMLAYLSTILSRDYETFTACDGEEAFELAQKLLPQVIVSDVMMPRKNGYTLVKDLKRDPKTRSIPIILVTAKADVHQKIAGIDIGADDYLTKPFNFLELRARIRSLLRTRALERSLSEKNDYLAKINFDLVLSKKEVFVQTIEALAFALEAKDPYTHGHSRRVSLLSTQLATSLSLSEVEIERVRVSAVLHDIGKLGIPEHILQKEGRLDAAEQFVIERHPAIGFEILQSVRELADVTRCILLHHEKFDGTGYPERRLALDIPRESRIIAVADTYDAMTSDRPYRKGLGHLRAIQELKDFAGTQFDPEVVRGFLHLFESQAPVFPTFPSAFGRGKAR